MSKTAVQPLNIVLGGTFQTSLNILMNKANIPATAAGFKRKFTPQSPYKMGTWATGLVDDTGFGGIEIKNKWAAFCADIPAFMRSAVEQVITENMYNSSPMPMYFQIQKNNVEPKHQLELRTVFDSTNQPFIGITIMCP